MDINNQYGTYERQCKLLEMMKELHNMFIENGIQYCLCGGSALGAIRHKGFIPWDDDIDIIFDRQNFNKFIKAFEGNNKYEIVQDIWVPRIVQKNSLDAEPFIDLFIFDNVPECDFVNKIKVFVLKVLQGMMKIKENIDSSKYSLVDKLLVLGTRVLGKCFTFKFKKNIYNKVSQWGNKKQTQYINGYNALYKFLPYKYPANIIKGYKDVEFEDTKLTVMAGYDEYLTILYGDYMTPPPITEQKPQHLKNKCKEQ